MTRSTEQDALAARRPYGRRQLLQAAGACAAAVAAASCGTTTAPTPRPAASTGAPKVIGSRSPSPQPSGHALALPPEVRHGPRNRPGVALTFHGQGTPAQVDALLGALENGRAHGTILAVGTWLRSDPSFARRVLDGGHELGNHTMHHLAIASMSRSAASAEIRECADLLRSLTGSIGTWFRPSQTQFATPTILAAASSIGYPTSLSYDVDSLDYTDPGVDVIVANVLEHAQNGSIVSMHAGHPQTVTAMPAVLDGLRKHGLQPMTMTGLMSQ